MPKDWTECDRGLFEDNIRHEGLSRIRKDNRLSISTEYNTTTVVGLFEQSNHGELI